MSDLFEPSTLLRVRGWKDRTAQHRAEQGLRESIIGDMRGWPGIVTANAG